MSMSEGEWIFVGVVALVMVLGAWYIVHLPYHPPMTKEATYCGADNKFCWSETAQDTCDPTAYFYFGWGGEPLKGYLKNCN